MSEIIPDSRVIKSYVWHQDGTKSAPSQCFFVSTIERDSSACADQSRYNETIVWEYNWAKAERCKMIYQSSEPKGSIKNHLMICQQFYSFGQKAVEILNKLDEI